MSKGLEALKEIIDYAINEFTDNEKKYQKDLEIIEKELKALEIIRKKGLNVNDIAWLKRNDYESYKWNLEQIYKDYDNQHLERVLKTKEEYELLKEVLL